MLIIVHGAKPELDQTWGQRHSSPKAGELASTAVVTLGLRLIRIATRIIETISRGRLAFHASRPRSQSPQNGEKAGIQIMKCADRVKSQAAMNRNGYPRTKSKKGSFLFTPNSSGSISGNSSSCGTKRPINPASTSSCSMSNPKRRT